MKHIIFDFDGVIVDSEKEKFLALRRVMNKHRYKVVEYEYENFIGKKRGSFIRELFPDISHDELTSVMNDIHLEDTQLEFALMKGIKELLKRLKEKKDYVISLATGSDRKTVMNVLLKHCLVDYFSTIGTGDEVKESKPNPAVFNYVICKHPQIKDIIIEDSPAGIEAAHKTPATVIGFGLDHSLAHVIVNNHEELLKWFEIKAKNHVHKTS